MVDVIHFDTYYLTKSIKKMLKKVMIMACNIALLSAYSQAQASDSTNVALPKTTQTLFGNLKPKINKIGLYIAPEFQYFGAANTYTPARGAAAMLIFNERLSIGVAGANTQRFTPKALNNANLRMNYAYAGGQIEYTFAPHKILHFAVPLFVGAGQARVDTLGSFGRRGRDWDDFSSRNRNPFFIVQPGFRLEANIIRFAKLYVGANYRAVLGTNSVTYFNGTSAVAVTNSQLSGLSFSAGLKVGLFDFKTKRKKQGTR